MNDKKINRFLELDKNWKQFLHLFFGDKIEILQNPFNRRFSYKVFNLLDSDIDLDNSRGFFTLYFKNEDDKKLFIKEGEIKKTVESQKTLDNEYDKAVWGGSKNKFPCRIYLNPKTQLYPENINFYDLAENKLSIDEEMENRIIVLESILETIIRYKIKKMKSRIQ